MSYVKTIKEDGAVSDIMAVALDPTLDATILHKSELVNGFTQTTPGVNALDAAAGKSLNDSLANLSTDVSTNYATKTDLSNHIIVRDYTVNSVSVNANATVWVTAPSIAVSGYTPRAIVGYYSNVTAVPYSLRLVNDVPSIALRNYMSSAQSGSFQFFVLYTKNI